MKKLSCHRLWTRFCCCFLIKAESHFLRDVSNNYNKFADELKGIIRANLISATELSSETFEQIRSALSKMTGKQVLLDTEENPV